VTSRWRWWTPLPGLFVILASLAFAPPAAAQDDVIDDELAADMPVDEEEGGAPAPGATPELDVDALLMQDDESFTDEGYSYEPGERRDPFASLREARERRDTGGGGPRPEGVPGLLISEIDLTGIFVLPDGPVAQVQAADQDKSFLLRVGDRLHDGNVVSISRGEVVFRQEVDDPAALKPFREVVKKLNP
jgi:hypothetical protein